MAAKGWRGILDTAATISVIALCGTLIWSTLSARRPPPIGAGRQAQRRAEPPLPSDPISLDGAAIQGDRHARVAIVEYSDFQCPYCGVFARDTLPAIAQQYVRSGSVLLAFRQFPLEGLHAYALKAAEGAECAGRQGKFWQMHDELFQRQHELDDASLLIRAQALKLDADQFGACLQGQTADKIRSDEMGGKALAVSGTPTFFVGAVQPDGRVRVFRRLTGVQSLSEFQDVLDRALGSGAPWD